MFDTLDFRVYTTPGADWRGIGHGFPEAEIRFACELGVPYSFAGVMPYPAAVMLTDETNKVDLHLGSDYTINWNTQEVTITSGAATGDTIGLFVYEFGGGNQLYKGVYSGADVTDGYTKLSVPVSYYNSNRTEAIQEFAIFVNGSQVTAYSFYPEYGGRSITVEYNPDASSGTTLSVTSTAQIRIGDQITGDGLTGGRIVESIVSSTAVIINAAPDGTVGAILTVTPATNSTLIAFALDVITSDTDFISLVAIGPTTINGVTTNYSWSIPLQQYITGTPSTYTYALTNSLEYTNPVNPVITLNGQRLRTAVGVEYISDGATQTYLVAQRLGIDQADIDNVIVYVNNVQTSSYTLYPNTNGSYITFNSTPAVGSTILIYVNNGSQAYIDPMAQQLIITDTSLNTNAPIVVTTWNDTREQRLLTKVFVGPVQEGITVTEGFDSVPFDEAAANNNPGSYDYSEGSSYVENELLLGRVVTDPARLWVSLNGAWLAPGIDYTVSSSNEAGEEDETGSVLVLPQILAANDVVMVTMYTNSVVPEAMAFRIFQDMRGIQGTYRITPATTTYLTQDATATADTIYVYNAAALPTPDVAQNIWGVVTIDGERIMYREIDLVNNTISSLLRGTAGTAAAEHYAGTAVYDMSHGNLLPPEYQNTVVETTTIADGSQTVFVAPNINLE
jgi:hypothetical protein